MAPEANSSHRLRRARRELLRDMLLKTCLDAFALGNTAGHAVECVATVELVDVWRSRRCPDGVRMVVEKLYKNECKIKVAMWVG